MKRPIFLLFAMAFLLGTQVKAQVTVSMPQDLVAWPGQQVEVPVHIDFGTVDEMCGFHFFIEYDDAVISFIEESDAHPSLNSNLEVTGNNGLLDITWFGGAFEAPNGVETLFNLKFTYIDGSTDISFTGDGYPDPSNLTDCTQDTAEILTTFVDGYIEKHPPVPLANWGLYAGLGLIVLLSMGFAYYRFV